MIIASMDETFAADSFSTITKTEFPSASTTIDINMLNYIKHSYINDSDYHTAYCIRPHTAHGHLSLLAQIKLLQTKLFQSFNNSRQTKVRIYVKYDE